jgi:hypothetical protein
VKASINAMAIEKGTHKNQYGTVLWAWGQNGPVRTCTSHMPNSSRRTIFSGVYIWFIFSSCWLKINHITGNGNMHLILSTVWLRTLWAMS